MSVLHLAIPTHDLDAATAFYAALGAEPGRRYSDRQSFNFFGLQLVCHLDPEFDVPDDPIKRPYPHHFGANLESRSEIEDIYQACRRLHIEHLSALQWRFAEKPERHLTFWTADPSGNVLEFKWYENPALVY